MIKQVIVVRRDLKMRKGKIAAQVAHASMMFFSRQFYGTAPLQEAPTQPAFYSVMLKPAEFEWLRGAFTKIVLGCDNEDELTHMMASAVIADVSVYHVEDSPGHVEGAALARTITCAAFGPEQTDLLDAITGKLTPL